MNLYLISQNVNNDYDAYDSAVVCAESETEAQKMSPSPYYKWNSENNYWEFKYGDGSVIEDNNESWAPSITQVQVMYLGKADDKYQTPTIICASFNAG